MVDAGGILVVVCFDLTTGSLSRDDWVIAYSNVCAYVQMYIRLQRHVLTYTVVFRVAALPGCRAERGCVNPSEGSQLPFPPSPSIVRK